VSNPAPFFPFYVDDWLDNDQIFDMSLECEGAYIRLLAAMWKRGGFLPDKDRLICNLLRCRPAKWKKIRKVFVDEIGVFKASNGQIFNTRLSEELQLSNKNINRRPPGHEWKELREIVFNRDDYTCQYCGERGGKLECDHVFPVSRGGSNEFDNLVTACFSCNRSKRDKTPEEWGIH